MVVMRANVPPASPSALPAESVLLVLENPIVRPPPDGLPTGPKLSDASLSNVSVRVWAPAHPGTRPAADDDANSPTDKRENRDAIAVPPSPAGCSFAAVRGREPCTCERRKP